MVLGTWVTIKPEHRPASCYERGEVMSLAFVMDGEPIWNIKFYLRPDFTQTLIFGETELEPIDATSRK